MGQSPRAVKAIYRRLELLEKYGINFLTHAGTMRKLQGYNLWEIVIDVGRICYRIFCVLRNTVCYLLHGFMKKSNETPRREIETALNRVVDLNYQLSLAVN